MADDGCQQDLLKKIISIVFTSSAVFVIGQICSCIRQLTGKQKQKHNKKNNNNSRLQQLVFLAVLIIYLNTKKLKMDEKITLSY